MKKIITILAAAALMLSASNAFAQIAVGAGYLNATDKVKVGNDDTDANLNGAYAGISFNIPIAGGFAVAPGLYYSALFAKDDILSVGSLKVDGKTTEHFINVPVNFNLGFDLAPDMTAFVFAGPTLQYGLASKTKVEGSVGGNNGDYDIDNYKDGSNYNKMNVLLGGGVGMNLMDTFQITVGYDYGLLDLNKSDDIKRNKSYIKLGVAYLF